MAFHDGWGFYGWGFYGWGFYGWHGVPVPETVILAPQQLTQDDLLAAPDAEVRRIIQERMRDRLEP
jgi:hypothetical protein